LQVLKVCCCVRRASVESLASWHIHVHAASTQRIATLTGDQEINITPNTTNINDLANLFCHTINHQVWENIWIHFARHVVPTEHNYKIWGEMEFGEMVDCWFHNHELMMLHSPQRSRGLIKQEWVAAV